MISLLWAIILAQYIHVGGQTWKFNKLSSTQASRGWCFMVYRPDGILVGGDREACPRPLEDPSMQGHFASADCSQNAQGWRQCMVTF